MRVAVGRLIVTIWVAGTVLASAPASAQYFGQNKVQYRTFKYEVLKTEHFDVYFYPEERASVEQAARMAERWYARFNRIFTHKLTGRQPLILYADQPDFQQTNAIPGDIGEGTGGVTEPIKRRIVLPMGASLAETDHVIGHELVHAFQYDLTSSMAQNGIPGIERLPLWFIEGMAEYLSLGPVDPNTAMWMRDAVRQNNLPTLKDLNNSAKYFPYRWGQALWAYVAGRWGDRAISDLLLGAGATGDVTDAMAKLLGVMPDQLSRDWHASLRAAYQPVVAETTPATDVASLVIAAKGLGNDLNVSPAISPDGKKLVFLSSRSLFSIDLYVADVTTGKIERQLVKTAVNPHFNSLQFIYSAGGWWPDGRRFVFAAVTNGEPELVLVDMTRKSVEREIRFPNLGEIFSPSVSPDGRSIAFSATAGGQSDLYAYDLSSGKLEQLTNDLFADLQPAWSPDGRSIAFVTDRFTTNLSDLKTGNYRLGLIDRASREVRQLPGFDDGKNINPQWASDGRSLYFLSDRNGISNVYRVDMASGSLTQVTNVLTGVAGITNLSPALSIAARSDVLSYSVFENGKYQIYATKQANPVAVALLPAPIATQAAVLPPANRPATGLLQQELSNPRTGLPPVHEPDKVSPYRARLSLDAVGQPYVATGIDPYGTFAGGGVSFFWSDMLGNHNLATALQINTGGFGGGVAGFFRNSGGLVAYSDLSHRWNWGVAAQQVPFYTGGYQTVSTDNSSGSALGTQTTILFHQTERSVTGVAAYPFNRAQRVEFSGGFTNIVFSQQMEQTSFALDTGNVVSDVVSDVSTGRSLNLAQAGAALVYDTAIFGATSPIDGQRYRLEVTPTFGSIGFTNVLADYRRYFMPVDLYTIAGRIVHFGRYGSSANDPRLWPLYLGYPNLVRGYDINSISATDCNPDGTCPAFDRLLGSKMLVGNLEFRFPLLRPFGLKRGVYGPVPVEIAFFGDAGVAWTGTENGTEKNLPWFVSGGTRKPISSAGVAFRVNALGYAVLEFDAVHPFSRPGQGWVFQFNLTPGF
jgi:Tol biopolymer transport system component